MARTILVVTLVGAVPLSLGIVLHHSWLRWIGVATVGAAWLLWFGIRSPTARVMPKDWLKRRVTVQQAEAEHMVTDARLGREPVPFGFCNREWRGLIAKMQPDDELWEFSHVEGPCCGGGGFALIRHGELVGTVTTWKS